jgi:hypothetical protein
MTPFLTFLRNKGVATAKVMSRDALRDRRCAGDTVVDGVFVVAAAAEVEDDLIPLVTSLNWDTCLSRDNRFVRNPDHLPPCWLCSEDGEYVGNLAVRCTNPDCRVYRDPVSVGVWRESDYLVRVAYDLGRSDGGRAA